MWLFAQQQSGLEAAELKSERKSQESDERPEVSDHSERSIECEDQTNDCEVSVLWRRSFEPEDEALDASNSQDDGVEWRAAHDEVDSVGCWDA